MFALTICCRITTGIYKSILKVVKPLYWVSQGNSKQSIKKDFLFVSNYAFKPQRLGPQIRELIRSSLVSSGKLMKTKTMVESK